MISACNTRELEVTSQNETVTSVSGKLMDVLIYDNIKSLRIESSPMLQFFPKKIEKFFPNIEKLTITQTGLKIFTTDDIKPFTKLKNLDLSENQLEELNAELFAFNEDIEEIDLTGNKLKHLGENFLKFAGKLKTIDMSENVCINASAKNPVELKRLKIKLNENCPASKVKIDKLKFSLNFVLISFAVIIFVAIVWNCMKCIVKK